MRSHVRRLEALRRAGHVERIDADQWKVPYRQIGSDGATWLDRELTARDRLVDMGLATAKEGKSTFRSEPLPSAAALPASPASSADASQ